jgi:glucosamine kinase
MIVVGVDAGGSRTRVEVWRDGAALGGREGPGAALRPGRVLQAASAIAATAKATLAGLALTRADVLVVGAAGAGRPGDADELRVALRGEYVAERVVVTTDVALALASVPAEVRIVLLAGTGTVALGRRPGGETVRQGGHGWQMGDEGSGYWLGREALVAAGRAADGRGPPTSLGTALLHATGSPTLRELAAWAAVASPREVATLAATVATGAAAGDAVATDILDRAAAELELLVAALAGRLDGEPGVVALGGGLLGEGAPLRDRVTARLGAAGYALWDRPVEPVRGALALGTTPAP